MAIKWNISGKAMKMRGLMDQISSEYDGGIEMGTEHLADVKAIRAQLGDMQDDLVAAANVMGNGSGHGSDESGQQQAKGGATTLADQLKNSQADSAANLEATVKPVGQF